MFKNRFSILIAGACLGLPLAANTVLNTFPDGPSTYTNAYVLEAQTFITPSDNVLSDFAFQMFNAPGQLVQLEIFAWGASGPVGSALYTSNSVARTNALLNLTVSGINLALTTGNEYGAVLDSFGYSGENAAYNTNQTSYSGGDLWLVSNSGSVWADHPGLNLYFQATFVPGQGTSTPEPGAVVLMGAGLGVLGLLVKRKRA